MTEYGPHSGEAHFENEGRRCKAKMLISQAKGQSIIIINIFEIFVSRRRGTWLACFYLYQNTAG